MGGTHSRSARPSIDITPFLTCRIREDLTLTSVEGLYVVFLAGGNRPPGRFEKQISAWFDQYPRQVNALKDLPNARQEWNTDDKSVADAFRRRPVRDPRAYEMLVSGRLTINWVPMPKDG